MVDTSRRTAWRKESELQFVLMDMAYGTGGTFFHNSNDLEVG